MKAVSINANPLTLSPLPAKASLPAASLKKIRHKAEEVFETIDRIATPPPGPLSRNRTMALKAMTLANTAFQLCECAALPPGLNVVGAIFSLQQGLVLYHLISPERGRGKGKIQKLQNLVVQSSPGKAGIKASRKAEQQLKQLGDKLPEPIKQAGKKAKALAIKIDNKLTISNGPISERHSRILKTMALGSIAFQVGVSTLATMGANLISGLLWVEDGVVFLNLIPPGTPKEGEKPSHPRLEKLKRGVGKIANKFPEPIKKTGGKAKARLIKFHELISPNGAISPRRNKALKLMNILSTAAQVGMCLAFLPPGFNVLAALAAFQEGVVLYNMVPLPNIKDQAQAENKSLSPVNGLIAKMAGLNRPQVESQEKAATGAV